MTRPAPRAVLLLAAGFPVALLPALVARALWVAWALYLALALALIAAEWLLATSATEIAVEASAPPVLYVGDRDLLCLTVTIRGSRSLPVELLCDLGENLEPQRPTRALAGPRGVEVRIPLVPRRRGAADLVAVWLRWTGPFGLLRFTETRELGRQVAVVPNVHAVRGAALRFFRSRQFQSGLKIERYIGDGSEFESLREHLPGLDTRSLDWKASARHRKLLSREFRAERNHAVVLALDSGYLMAEPLAGIPKLDHGINAALLLAYVALKTGDRVGLYAFDERPRRYAEPSGGVASFARLQHLAARIDYSHVETNFTLGILELTRRLRRRSLVVVITDFVDSVTAELMVENLERMRKGHLVLFVGLRDAGLEAMARQDPRDLDSLNRAMVARDLLRERDTVLHRLRRAGVHCIDSPPRKINTHLINRYLEVKRRELV